MSYRTGVQLGVTDEGTDWATFGNDDSGYVYKSISCGHRGHIMVVA